MESFNPATNGYPTTTRQYYSPPYFYPSYNWPYAPNYYDNMNQMQDFKNEPPKPEENDFSALQKSAKRFPQRNFEDSLPIASNERKLNENELSSLFELIKTLTDEKQKLSEKFDAFCLNFDEKHENAMRMIRKLEAENREIKEEFRRYKEAQVCVFLFFQPLFYRKELIFLIICS